MDAVLAEDRSAARGHPDSSQCVAVNLVLLDHSLAFLVLKQTSAVSKTYDGTLSFLFMLLETNKPNTIKIF